jgi:hypothetical protein
VYIGGTVPPGLHTIAMRSVAPPLLPAVFAVESPYSCRTST